MEKEGDDRFCELDTSLGRITGHIVKAPNGEKVAKFLGIPYAQQPVGKLRFKPLQDLHLPIGTEELPFYALRYGNSSIQKRDELSSTSLPIGENCIYLNIFAPLRNIDRPHRPVFFHIHGGGFFQGSGSEPFFDLVSFVERHNCVGVSINYRLGVLGFLSLPPLIEANLGLKDQQFALKWVHEHIRSFGGSPNNVTIYGCSAGGASCHYHCVNKFSNNLFNRAIISSGVINPYWTYASRKDQVRRVSWVLKRLGCPNTGNTAEILEFLLSVEASKFESIGANIEEMLKMFPRIVKTFMENPDSLVPFKRKPILIGLMQEEGSLAPTYYFPSKTTQNGLTKTRKTMADAVGEIFTFGSLRQTMKEVITKHSDYPLFAYVFDYETETRGREVLSPLAYPAGVGKCHGLDTAFFLNQLCPNSPYVRNVTDSDVKVNSALAQILEMFMTQDVDEIDLPIYSLESRRVMRITENGVRVDEFDFKNTASNCTTLKLLYSSFLLRLFPNKF